MYTPPHFSVESKDELFAFMCANPFGLIVSSTGNLEPKATHLPFLIKKNDIGELFIEGHIANVNEHTEILKTGRSALVVFTGAHGYVSSSVYEKPDAPTWNYQSVHAYGTIRKLTNDELKSHLNQLMSQHEMGQNSPISMKDIPERQVSDYLKLITGFELKIYKTEATYKLSQNRSEKDFEAIISHLEKERVNDKLVQEMKRVKKG